LFVCYPAGTPELNFRSPHQNNSGIALADVVVTASLAGELFDMQTLSTKGRINSITNSIEWNASNAPQLKLIDVGASGDLYFQINLVKNFPITRLSDKNFVVRVQSHLDSPSVPFYLQATKTVSDASLDTKVGGAVFIDAQAFYRDASSGIANQGPFPPRTNTPTEYTIHWVITNYSTDIKNIKVTTALEPGVQWTGSSEGRSCDLEIHAREGNMRLEIADGPEDASSVILPTGLFDGQSTYDVAVSAHKGAYCSSSVHEFNTTGTTSGRLLTAPDLPGSNVVLIGHMLDPGDNEKHSFHAWVDSVSSGYNEIRMQLPSAGGHTLTFLDSPLGSNEYTFSSDVTIIPVDDSAFLQDFMVGDYPIHFGHDVGGSSLDLTAKVPPLSPLPVAISQPSDGETVAPGTALKWTHPGGSPLSAFTVSGKWEGHQWGHNDFHCALKPNNFEFALPSGLPESEYWAGFGVDAINADGSGGATGIFFENRGVEFAIEEPTITPTPTPTYNPVKLVPSQYGTIQEAIDAANDNDRIIVSSGRYFENINFKGKDIVLTSENPDDNAVVLSTIIDGDGADSVVRFSALEPTTCRLEGFTITNGQAASGGGINGSGTLATISKNLIMLNNATSGGGIAFLEGLLRDNVIARNTATSGGGLYSCNGTIEDNMIYDNTGQNGGGVYLSWGTFKRNRIFSNDASDSGGGFNMCDGIIKNNFIYGNTAVSYGGGVYLGTGLFHHNTVYGNRSDFVGGGISYYSGSIKNCIVWGNTAPSGAQLGNATNPISCCIQDYVLTIWGNMNVDPELKDPNRFDFHLKPSSPCIDAGYRIREVKEDFDRDRRPINGTNEPRKNITEYDIGADEYDPTPETPSFFLRAADPIVVVEEGQKPKFHFALIPINGFNKPVTFGLAGDTLSFRFYPNNVVPPAAITLVLPAAHTDVESESKTITVTAEDSLKSATYELDLTYEIVKPSITRSSLSIQAQRETIRLGDATRIVGKLVPGNPNETIDISISVFADDGSPLFTDNAQVQTRLEGRFVYELLPPEQGTYRIVADLSALSSLPHSTSNSVVVDVVPRESRLSLKLDLPQWPSVGEPLAFFGRLTPIASDEPSAINVHVWYDLHDGISSATELYPATLVGGDYNGVLLPSQSGVMRIQTTWAGAPPNVNGAQSPPIVVPVSEAPVPGGAKLQTTGIDPGVAVLIAGATSTSLYTEVRDYLSNLSYYVLNNRRFNDLHLEYANDNSEQDVDWDTLPDAGVVDIVESSTASVDQALDAAATIADVTGQVSVFVVAEEGDGANLLMGDGSVLSATELDTMLSARLGTTRDVRVLVEASDSGDFCDALASSNRTIICSASTEQASYFADGLLSFSQLFMTQVQAGWSISDSFEYARDYLRAVFGYYGAQTPALLDGDDFDASLLYYGISSDATDMLAPDIEGVFEPLMLDQTPEAEIFARATDDTELYTVEASVRKPNGQVVSVTLTEEYPGSRKYLANIQEDVLTHLGYYDVTFIALDAARNASEPQSSEILFVSVADLNGDMAVNAADLFIIAEEMHTVDSVYDIVEDGYVDYKDLLAVARRWRP